MKNRSVDAACVGRALAAAGGGASRRGGGNGQANGKEPSPLSVSVHTLPAQVAAYAVALRTACPPKWPHTCTNIGGEFLDYRRDFLH